MADFFCEKFKPWYLFFLTQRMINYDENLRVAKGNQLR